MEIPGVPSSDSNGATASRSRPTEMASHPDVADRKALSILAISAETFAVRSLVALLSVGISILIARALGPEGRGMYSYPLVVASLLATFFHLSLGQANVHVYSQDNSSFSDLGPNSGLVACVAVGMCLPIMVLVVSIRPGGLNSVPLGVLLFAFGAVPFTIHQIYLTGLLQLTHHLKTTNRLAFLAASVQLAAIGFLFLAGRLTVLSVVAVSTGVAILHWALTVGALRNIVGLRPRYLPGVFERTLRFALSVHLGMAMVSLQLRADVLLLERLSGFAAVGLYTLAVMLGESIWMMTDAVAAACLPHQAAASAAHAGRITLRACRVSLLLALCAAVGLSVLSYPVIRLAYGDLFLASVPALLALLPGVVFYSVQRVCGAYILRLNHPFCMSGILALSVALNLGLNYLWIPRWGIVGAALASTVSYVFSASCFWCWAIRISGIPLAEAVLWSVEDTQAIRRVLRLRAG